jgi:hypothetical protein
VTITSDGRLVIGREIEPFEVAVLTISLMYGLVATFRYDLAATSVRMYPGYGGRFFLVLLALGGLVGLMGVLNRSRWGMRLEGAGLTLLSILGLAYGLWTPFSVGARGVGLLLFLGVLLFVPSAVLARRLRRYLRRAEEMEAARAAARAAAETAEINVESNDDGTRPEAT